MLTKHEENVLLSQANDLYARCLVAQGSFTPPYSIVFVCRSFANVSITGKLQIAALPYQALAGAMTRDMTTTQRLLVRFCCLRAFPNLRTIYLRLSSGLETALCSDC